MCIDEKHLYKLDGLDYELQHKWVEISIERCKQTTTNRCAIDSEIDDFIKYLQVMPVTNQKEINIAKKLENGKPELHDTIQYYGVQQLNPFQNNKVFIFLKENKFYLYDDLVTLINEPTTSGTYFNFGEVHRSQEIHPDT